MHLENTDVSEYAVAFKSVNTAKNVFLVLLIASIGIQLVSFVLVDFVGVIDPIHEKAAAEAATQPAEEETSAGSATVWNGLLNWIMPGTKFLAVVATFLFMLTLVLAVKLALVGHLPGVAGYVSGFFWSLILLVIVIPWQQVIKADFASGALYNLEYLVTEAKLVKKSWGGDPAWYETLIYYLRFIVYPLAALLLTLVVQKKIACGFKQLSPAEETAGPSEPAE